MFKVFLQVFCLKGFFLGCSLINDLYTPPLNNISNKKIITQKSVSTNLKLADVTPVSKKEDISLLKNDRPVNVLPVVSKIYVRVTQR